MVYVRIPASAFSRWGRPRAAGARMPASHRTATRAPKEQDIARIVGMVHAWAGVYGCGLSNCVISAPVILYGGHIYTFTLFKRGQRVCVCTRAKRARESKNETEICSISFLGFIGMCSKHYYIMPHRVVAILRVCAGFQSVANDARVIEPANSTRHGFGSTAGAFSSGRAPHNSMRSIFTCRSMRPL